MDHKSNAALLHLDFSMPRTLPDRDPKYQKCHILTRVLSRHVDPIIGTSLGRPNNNSVCLTLALSICSESCDRSFGSVMGQYTPLWFQYHLLFDVLGHLFSILSVHCRAVDEEAPQKSSTVRTVVATIDTIDKSFVIPFQRYCRSDARSVARQGDSKNRTVIISIIKSTVPQQQGTKLILILRAGARKRQTKTRQ